MEKEKDSYLSSSESEEVRQAMPKKEAKVSLVLNGVGNGMMIGTFPFVGMELYHHLTGWEIPKKAHGFNAFALVAGSALGAWYGTKEANRLHGYRETLVDEVEKLRHEVNTNNQRIQQWTDKIQLASAENPEKSR